MALTRCAALDVAPHGIRVNAVSPSLAMHPFLAKVTSDELLARAQAARGVRPCGRAVGGRQRHGLPGQRLLVLPDRRGHLCQQPACLRTHQHAARPSCWPSPPGCSPSAGFKNTTVRDIADAAGILSGSLYHHFDSKEAMVDELLDSFQTELWEEYDAIEASRPDATGEARSSRAGLLRRHRPAPQRGRDLPDRRVLSRDLRAVRLPRGAQRALPRPVDRPPPRRRGRPASCAPTSTSSSSTGSCATPSGSPCAGTAPAAT